MPNPERDALRSRLYAKLDQSDLTTRSLGRAARVLTHLVAACDVEGRAIIRQATIAERTHTTTRTVQRGLDDLEAAGLIVRTRSTKRLRHRESRAEGASVYQLLDPATQPSVPDVIPASIMQAAEGASWRSKLAASDTTDTTPDTTDTTPDDTTNCRTGGDKLSYGRRQTVVPSSSSSSIEQEHSDAEAALAAASGAAEHSLLGATDASAAASGPGPRGPVPTAAADAADDLLSQSSGDHVDTEELYRTITKGLPDLRPAGVQFAVDVLRSREDGITKAIEVIERSKGPNVTSPAGYFMRAMREEQLNPTPCRQATGSTTALTEVRPLYHRSAAEVQSYFSTLEANYLSSTEPATEGDSKDGGSDSKGRRMGRLYVAMLKAGKSHAEVGDAFRQLEDVAEEDAEALVEACANPFSDTVDVTEWVDPDDDQWPLKMAAIGALEAASEWNETEVALDYAGERSINREPYPASAIQRRIDQAYAESIGPADAQAEADHAAACELWNRERPATPLLDQWEKPYDDAYYAAILRIGGLDNYNKCSKDQRAALLEYGGLDVNGYRAAYTSPEWKLEREAREAWHKARPHLEDQPSWPAFTEAILEHPLKVDHRLIGERELYRLGECRAWFPVWLLHVYQHYACDVRPYNVREGEEETVRHVQVGVRRPRPLTLEEAGESAGIAVDMAYDRYQREQRRKSRQEDD